ncbi:hypothetical protein SALBM311S_04820 [Streptomyces alboniger]
MVAQEPEGGRSHEESELSEKMTRRSPTAPETALARTTAARPKRPRKNLPLKRPRVIAAANPT